jgi:hypothetical protein
MKGLRILFGKKIGRLYASLLYRNSIVVDISSNIDLNNTLVLKKWCDTVIKIVKMFPIVKERMAGSYKAMMTLNAERYLYVYMRVVADDIDTVISLLHDKVVSLQTLNKGAEMDLNQADLLYAPLRTSLENVMEDGRSLYKRVIDFANESLQMDGALKSGIYHAIRILCNQLDRESVSTVSNMIMKLLNDKDRRIRTGGIACIPAFLNKIKDQHVNV